MSEETAATTTPTEETVEKRKRKASRKGKKEWRKNVDITDVEETLAELVTEEITGSKVEARKDEDLFMVDVSGDGSRRSRKEPKKLYIEEVIEKRSYVPAPIQRVKVTEVEQSKTMEMQINALAERIKAGKIVPQKPSQRKKKPVVKADQYVAHFDPWAETGDQQVEAGKKNHVLPEVIPTPAAKRKPSSIAKNNVQLEAVKVSHPGTSYRPTEKDRVSLLQQQRAELERAEKEKRILDAKLSYPVKRKDESDHEVDKMEEDEPEKETEQGEEKADEHTETKEKKEETKRKTKAQRNREKRLRQALLEAAKERRRKLMRKRLDQLAKLTQEVEMKIAAREERAKERKKLRALQATLPKTKLGRAEVPKDKIQVQGEKEVADSLRRIKPKGNLLRDRYLSLLQRNIIEPRSRVRRRHKPRYKIYNKA